LKYFVNVTISYLVLEYVYFVFADLYIPTE
jgi:hypothetical protein